MNTDDLITLLATGVSPVDRRVVAKRFGMALLLGLAAALLLIATGFGVRADLAAIAGTPLFWAKLALPAALLLGALLLATRMARPGM
ncbi:NrsF family protein, partial [Pseudomonas sp. BAY1663]|uniref:NrsF family protein n=1 Tax=Pseudomonas sp. BAY1663 TaxID=1439940 RepID=UPI00055DFD81